MSQNDFTIANQGFPAFRADLNSALQALASNSSGATAPSTTFANMWWYDSTNNIMYIRNEDNDAWIKFAELDQTNDKFVLSGTLQLDDGTVSAPALTFNSDTNMGIYRGGTDILKFVTAGTDAITIDASQGVTLAGKLDVSSGTIKLDGNYPVGTDNVALGNASLDSLTTGSNNTSIGNSALTGNTEGASNVAIGRNALRTNTTSDFNIAIGDDALRNNTASNNTAVGYQSAYSNTTGSPITAIGRKALYSNTTGADNTALGRNSLFYNTTGADNTSSGNEAMQANTTGSFNTAYGSDALRANTTGTENTASGYRALITNTTGALNVAYGSGALQLNTTASNNSAFGKDALRNNTTASNNTAVGYQAGYSNTTGTQIVAVGRQAMYSNTTGSQSTAVGQRALYDNSTGQYNTALGYAALENNTTADNNTAVGFQAGYSGTTATGNTYLGMYTGFATTTGTANTFVGSDGIFGAGHLVTTGSKNTIIGRFNGNQDGFDIRTSSNNIVLSDGDGRALGYYTSSGAFWKFRGNANGYYACNIEQQTTGGSPYGLVVDYSNTAPDNQNGNFIRCQDTTTGRFIVYNDGDVVNHDNSYGAISDIKLKEQITDASSQWDDIKALTVRKYKMKSDVATGDSDAHWRLGVIAQEVETAGMNGLVKQSPDMIENENGELVDSGTTTKQVKYSILYMKAVKALQEAMERIETLEAKVATLEGE